jgi:LPS sulfotransferase NodH
LLCKTLESTGVAGKPDEWLNNAGDLDLVEFHGVSSHAELQKHIWEIGSTPNGILGVKFGFYEPHFSTVLDTFRKFPDCPQVDFPRAAIWQHAFPNCHHIFMTRRNKVRLAVSWWKAIKTQEWHRKTGANPKPADLGNEYLFEAIYHLFCESSMREAGIQEFFSEAGITPLTIVYEDFINEYDKTVRNVLDFLEVDSSKINIKPPQYARLADEISEQWAERFRNEVQKDWQNRGW